MEKENYSQLELFSQVGRRNDPADPANRSFLNYLRSYEMILLVIIGFIIIGIVCFSLGVESGKRQAVKRILSPAAMTVKILPAAPATVPPAPAAALKPAAGSYLIQLATFASKAHALAEAEALKKKGFYPLFFSKGSYIVLCVGNLANKEAAQSLLLELKKQYKDCIIRRF